MERTVLGSEVLEASPSLTRLWRVEYQKAEKEPFRKKGEQIEIKV